MLLESYDEGRLLWEAKGWIIEGVAAEIAAKPELASYKLATPTLQRYSVTNRHLPPPIAALIEGLKTQPKREHLTEIVETGLRVGRGQPAQRDPRELALAVLANFPTDDFALKLADALTKQAGISSGAGSLFDVVAQAVAGRLPRLQEEKLAGKLARRLDRLSPKRLALSGAAGGLVACVVLALGVVGLAFMLVSGRLQWAPREQGSPTTNGVTQPPSASHFETTMSDGEAALRAALAAVIGMSKKTEEHWIPKDPYPWQKLAKDCKPALGEKPINGGCWVWIADVQPPCGELFRYGDKCYRPVSADPTKPVGAPLPGPMR